MSLTKWTVGLMAGVSMLALSSAAPMPATVRVTIAEYSKGTGPYFEEAAKAFEAANPDTKIQIEVVPWDNSAAEADHRYFRRRQCRSFHHRHALAARFCQGRHRRAA